MKKTYFQVPGVQDFYSDRVGEVELDKEIALLIQTLNAKGYTTICSCAGHYSRKRRAVTAGYIWFRNIPKHEFIIKESDDKCIINGIYEDKDCIRWKSASVKLQKQHLATLLKWAESL